MWDQRYDRPGYLFGTEPAEFLKRNASLLKPDSRVLCVADGEGRNSVYLAKLGHKVTAFDASVIGVEKARKLADQRGVELNFYVSDTQSWDWTQTFDAVAGIFIQFAPPELRSQLFHQMAQSISPGGVLLLHGYAPRQVEYGTGGPPNASHMYTLEMLREAFSDFEILHNSDYDADIDEGEGHSGRSALVDFIARKAL